MSARCASKTTDKLVAVCDLLRDLHDRRMKHALITWDRIEDPIEGTVVVPILDLEFFDAR